MENMGKIGRWVYGIPFVIFGLGHFFGTNILAESSVPSWLPLEKLLVIMTGLGLIGGGVLILLDTMCDIGALLILVMLALFIAFIQLPACIHAFGELPFKTAFIVGAEGLLKDLALAGGALMVYASATGSVATPKF